METNIERDRKHVCTRQETDRKGESQDGDEVRSGWKWAWLALKGTRESIRNNTDIRRWLMLTVHSLTENLSGLALEFF